MRVGGFCCLLTELDSLSAFMLTSCWLHSSQHILKKNIKIVVCILYSKRDYIKSLPNFPVDESYPSLIHIRLRSLQWRIMVQFNLLFSTVFLSFLCVTPCNYTSVTITTLPSAFLHTLTVTVLLLGKVERQGAPHPQCCFWTHRGAPSSHSPSPHVDLMIARVSACTVDYVCLGSL